MSMNFENCTVIIYDAYGVPLRNTKIIAYDAVANYIEIPKYPEFYNGLGCELIILSEPAPYAFSGVVRTHAARATNVIITLFKGKVKESRATKRFKLSGKADIIHYIDNKKYDLHSHIKVNLVNISASGVRLMARANTLTHGDLFNLKLEIAGNDRILVTKVVNSKDSDMLEGYTEYGCLFIGDANG